MNISHILTYPFYIYAIPYNKDNTTVAHELAKQSNITYWDPHNKKVLLIKNLKGTTVAHYLALHSYESGWSTDDKDILLVADQYGTTVLQYLPPNSIKQPIVSTLAQIPRTTNWDIDNLKYMDKIKLGVVK